MAASGTLLTAPMKIDCYLSEHCGAYCQLRKNIERALKELGSSAEIDYYVISSDEAVSLGITGSPTIRLDGEDLVEGAGSAGIA